MNYTGNQRHNYSNAGYTKSGGGHYGGVGRETFGDQMKEFVKGAVEMSVEFGRGCRDIAVQSLGREDSFVFRYFGKDSMIGRRVKGPVAAVSRRLKFFHQYLPEDKDPVHALSVILLVFIVAMAALTVNTSQGDTPAQLIKKVYVHPPSAERILLPDGRYMAYKEQGVHAKSARFSVIAPHSFLSSRFAGIPGIKASLLEEFGVRLITYDLPGFGESDPHPSRSLMSSAVDMLSLANALHVDKFWVVGYSSGTLHAWASLRFIPDRLAGAALFAPMVNPYDSSMTREELRRTWGKWTRKRRFLYFLARRFPRLLAFFYQRSFLSGKHDRIDKWLSLSLGRRDKALVEDPIYEEFWQRDVEESIRQGNVKPFVEEAALQVSNWGFSLADVKLEKKKIGRGIFNYLKYIFSGYREEYTGFFGPIHIWQGMDDTVVPPAMTDFVHRVLPGAAVHKLPYEGHFTYLCFCDECHRQIFSTLFGTPQGPINDTTEIDQTTTKDETEVHEDTNSTTE